MKVGNIEEKSKTAAKMFSRLFQTDYCHIDYKLQDQALRLDIDKYSMLVF